MLLISLLFGRIFVPLTPILNAKESKWSKGRGLVNNYRRRRSIPTVPKIEFNLCIFLLLKRTVRGIKVKTYFLITCDVTLPKVKHTHGHIYCTSVCHRPLFEGQSLLSKIIIKSTLPPPLSLAYSQSI